ncbi:MAG: MTH1187 family thiamine-binding protein [candidate division WOR-3 bacterium]|nr:MTH1187 family thiamine-binding protein [candidate division WOR-3 bacterium]MCX7836507.1 MTH1187 family thiamine-binding protein [candidate division WOR-3 bacterium]MDW8114446.1 MTH1187 family thiamine-binding protein [candidate division WOR-3 bacterium]
MAIVDISVVPIGTGTPSVSNFVKEAIEIIKKSGLKYQVNPMGTTIEGDLVKILDLVKVIHQHYFVLGAQRILTTIRIDERIDKYQTMEEKVKKVIEE